MIYMGSQHIQVTLKIDKTILSSGKYYFYLSLDLKVKDVILQTGSFCYLCQMLLCKEANEFFVS